MGKLKNYMMEVEDFCDGYYYGVDIQDEKDFPIEDIIDDVDMYFKSDIATNYAREYLTIQIKEGRW